MKIKPLVAPFLICIIFVMPLCLTVITANAGGPAMQETITEKIPIFKSRNLKMKADIHRVSIGTEEVADILILRSDELYVVGKALGTTNVMVWDKNNNIIDIINIEVTHDLNSLRERFYHYLPEEKIGIESSQGQLVLSGEASSLAKLNLALELARGYSDLATVGNRKSEVLNMMSVGGGHQVMLEVTVAEVQTEVARGLDSRMILKGDGSNGGGGIISGGDLLAIIDPVLSQGLTNGLFGTYLGNNILFGFAFDIAKQHGLARVLAEPNITALSGQQATFLSGGEFPIPVPNEDGITIEYRDFGVAVTFVPTVLDSGKINLSLNVVVSEISNANTLLLPNGDSNSSFIVPSLVKRSTSTTVELGDGQTIAIGGLISDNVRESVDKLPGLGDIPILGQLFRSQQFIKGQTELVIMVTPRLVRPFNKKGVALPTDGFVESSDLDFYLLGKMSERTLKNGANNSPNKTEQLHDQAIPDNGGTQEKYGHALSTDEAEG
ncbi:type II and III secretion system protein family protein [Psychromonas hadalis]|uniref:type II and III secretion system protein family protein n=1 Tax=Psychromonas hadalis TaxID=211669 RepID=UPI0003B51692|nr:type II and III secretion system protein family protein [Psychromonas hadalis]